MKRGYELVMPIGGGHGGGLLSILVVMGHIVTARLPPLWQEGSDHFVPTVKNVSIKKLCQHTMLSLRVQGKTRTISATNEGPVNAGVCV
jgi:hypothetical protein